MKLKKAAQITAWRGVSTPVVILKNEMSTDPCLRM